MKDAESRTASNFDDPELVLRAVREYRDTPLHPTREVERMLADIGFTVAGKQPAIPDSPVPAVDGTRD